MHFIAYAGVLLSLLLSLIMGAVAISQCWSRAFVYNHWMRRGHAAQTGLITVSSLVLLWAFGTRDFSFKYVAEYCDTLMPQFYALTAFWAGQPGSLLFWLWMAALIGAVYSFVPAFRRLEPSVQGWYWLFFYMVMAFLLLLITCWTNPFLQLVPAPPDGNGMNPLLQNVAMIFHPPLLFLGYAGFTVPACLALGEAMAGGRGQGPSWLDAARNVTLFSWLFLTAGIVLGAWWSYMELGWGGYWAWDPVENASLVPWLASTAALHTGIVQQRRKSLGRTNVFLMGLSLIACFFATYLVRSGVVDSLHAFGGHGVGGPLLLFILASVVVSAYAALLGRSEANRPLEDLLTRGGLLFIAAWVLLILAAVVLMGTMWPVFSQLWSDNPVGLDQGFYNTAALPFFVLLAFLLAVCPWLGWKGGFRNMKMVFALAGVLLGALGVLALKGILAPLAMAGAAAGVLAAASAVLFVATEKEAKSRRSGIAAYGVHFGLALMVLGIAVSGPYQQSSDAVLALGETMSVAGYDVRYESLEEGETTNMIFIEAELTVTRDGQPVGVMRPQRRLYRKFDSPFAEAAVAPVFSLGNEVYATLLAADGQNRATLQVSVHPLVNWIWIGGTLMCLFPFVGMTRLRREPGAEDSRS